jgi:hypothetical protein
VYREITPNEPGAVDSYTVASRLSYFLWETMPDEALFAAAAAGELSTRAQVEAQARRMIRNERARTPLNRFFVEWLEVQTLAASFRDPELFPEYTSATRASMANQARGFFDRILWDRGASFDALYTSRELLVDDEMASLLDLAPPSGDASWVDVDHRAGILTLPAVMAVFSVPRRSDPIRRGVLVRRQLLCQELPDPPAGVVIEPPAVTEPSNIREELSQHAEGTCAGCHSLIDPVGLGFENYDALGRYRTQYADDSPVDARGELLDAEVTGEFDGAVQLAGMLASSGEARRCLAEKWFEYGFGRKVAPGDAASIDHAVAQMAANDDSILELVVALTTSEAFLNGEGN